MRKTNDTTRSETLRTGMSAEETLRALDRLVDSLGVQYEEMLDAMREHERAMREADIPAMASCVARENKAVQAIAELDKQRAEIVGIYERRVSEQVADGKREPATITSIALALGGEAGRKLAERAGELRSLVIAVRERTAMMHAAAEMLTAHTAGLMRQAVQVLNHAKVYSRGGAVSAGPTVMSALDLTS